MLTLLNWAPKNPPKSLVTWGDWMRRFFTYLLFSLQRRTHIPEPSQTSDVASCHRRNLWRSISCKVKNNQIRTKIKETFWPFLPNFVQSPLYSTSHSPPHPWSVYFRPLGGGGGAPLLVSLCLSFNLTNFYSDIPSRGTLKAFTSSFMQLRRSSTNLLFSCVSASAFSPFFPPQSAGTKRI